MNKRLILVSLAVLALFAASWRLRSLRSSSQSRPVPAAVPESLRKSENASPGSVAADKPLEVPAEREWVSRNGMRVRIPRGFAALSRPASADAQIEVVLFYPESADPDALWNDPDRIEKGTIVAEISPLTRQERADPDLREKVERGLNSLASQKGWKVRFARESRFRFPASIFEIENPRHLRILLFGEEQVYKFQALGWSPTLDSLVSSLEASEP